MWGQAARCEAQAHDLISAYETRLVLFNRANSSGHLAQHLKVLDQLESEMTTKTAWSPVGIAWADAVRTLAERADAEFARQRIERNTGEVRDPQLAVQRLQTLGQQFKQWSGAIYEKISGYFRNLAAGLFGYVPVLKRAMQPLMDRWGTTGVQALTRLWQCEADARRHARPVVEQLRLNQVWAAWDEVAALLGKVWRGSSLAECINSKLRPMLDRRDQTDQGCLALFQLLHNTRVFARGKRAGHSRAQLVHLDVPDAP